MSNDPIDEELLRQQEEEQREKQQEEQEQEQGYTVGDDGNGHDKEDEQKVTQIDPPVDLDPYIKNRDYAEYIIDTAKKTVKREDTLIRQIVYTALSKDSDNPLNLAVLAATGEGKTHAVVERM